MISISNVGWVNITLAISNVGWVNITLAISNWQHNNNNNAIFVE